MRYRPLVGSLARTGALLLAISPVQAAGTDLLAQARLVFKPLPTDVSTAPLTPAADPDRSAAG